MGPTVCHERVNGEWAVVFLINMLRDMKEPRELFLAYEAGIVSVRDPMEHDEQTAWSDPALFCLLRNQPCAVITAWNPGFTRLSNIINRRRNDELRAQLELEPYEYWDSLNSAPDGSFSEPGFLIWEITQDRALALALNCDQFAIYWYNTQGERVVLPCT